jgi:hypothetical protein
LASIGTPSAKDPVKLTASLIRSPRVLPTSSFPLTLPLFSTAGMDPAGYIHRYFDKNQHPYGDKSLHDSLRRLALQYLAKDTELRWYVVTASLPVCPSQRSKKDSGLTTTSTHSLAKSGREQVTLVPSNSACPTGKERPMNSHLAAHSNYSADRRGSHDETTLRDGSPGLAAPQLMRRAPLMLALVLSLALWATIWTAIQALASVALG